MFDTNLFTRKIRLISMAVDDYAAADDYDDDDNFYAADHGWLC